MRHVATVLPKIVTGMLVLGALTAFRPDADAGVIDPALEERMESATVEDVLPVVIRAVGTVVGTVLKADLASRYPARSVRHREAIRTLKAAAVSQKPILEALSSDYYDQRVFNVRSFWIDNVITAELTASAIAEIADHPDVDEVMLMPDVGLIAPLAVPGAMSTSPGAASYGSTESNLRAIKADSVWMMGYTGRGRLLASIDTGVSGSHPGLESRWRGNNGYSARESWYDPVYPDSTPHRFVGGLSPSHGTQVMSIMVGTLDIGTVINDTLGVCPDCQWISAAAIDIPCPVTSFLTCGNLFEALQWVADPDGDPMTETDVPDAVANPWGALTEYAGCVNVFWNAIDNVEAAGAAMIFAAGNEGPSPGSTRNPANRATSETNSFAVGMVDTRSDILTPPVDILSSRGPSDCDGLSIKPEVVAPGVNVRTFLGDQSIDPPGTGSGYGTSFSMPHVAAAIALLREYNPNATVDELKTAILNSAKDLGAPGPDNAYGHGLLDIMNAMRLLPENTQPDLYIKRDYYTRPAPGDTTELILLLRSAGAIAATGISVEMVSEHPGLNVIDGMAEFPDITETTDTTGNFETPFVVAVAPGVVSGERLPVRIEISADGGYARVVHASLQVGPTFEDDLFTHDAGNFVLTISATGMFGLAIDGLSPRPGGVGYFYGGDPTQSLFEGSFLVGTAADYVSDNARNASFVPDVDFRVDHGGRLEINEGGIGHSEETRSAFSDATAENPIGLFIEQRTWVDSEPESDDYLIVEYTIWNRSGGMITTLYAGLFFDWDFPMTGPIATRDGGGFNQDEGLGWMRHLDEERFRGLAVISPLGTTSYRYFDNLTELFDLDLMSESDKWNALSGGFLQTVPPTVGDGSHLIGSGPYAIAPDASVTVAFAIVGASSEADLVASVQHARESYFPHSLIVEMDILPRQCPNILDLRSRDRTVVFVPRSARAVDPTWLEVVVLGDHDFDVGSLDTGSLRLEGLEPVRQDYRDISSPVVFRERLCECAPTGTDGYTDLVMYFDRADLLSVLAPITSGERRTLTLSGSRQSGEPVKGSDCLKVILDLAPSLIASVHGEEEGILQNRPNPFNAATVISFQVDSNEPVRLEIFDVLGRRVTTLVDGVRLRGRHEVRWDGLDQSGVPVPSGVYLCRLDIGGAAVSRQIVLLR